jgi:polar amino acid transport system substrate-binding protein
MRFRHFGLGIACSVAALSVAACGSSGGNSENKNAPTGSQPAAADTSQCKTIRAKYPDLPKAWDVAISPYNGALEQVDPKNPDKIIGIEPDIVQSIATCLGAKVSFKSQPFASVIKSLTSGTAQIGLTGLFVTPARVEVISMVSYMKSVDAMFTLKDNASTFQSPDDMCGKKIGQTVGTAEADYVSAYSKTCEEKGKPSIKVSLLQDLGSLYANIENKRIDGTIGSDALEPLINESYKGKIVSTFKVPTLTLPVAFGISAKTADSHLAEAVHDVMTTLHDDGTIGKLLTKWTFPDSALIEPKLYSAGS